MAQKNGRNDLTSGERDEVWFAFCRNSFKTDWTDRDMSMDFISHPVYLSHPGPLDPSVNTLQHQAWCCNPEIREIPAEGEATSRRGRKWLPELEVHKTVPTHMQWKHCICLSRCGSNSIVSRSISGSPDRRMNRCLRSRCLCCPIHDLGTYTCLLFNIALILNISKTGIILSG